MIRHIIFLIVVSAAGLMAGIAVAENRKSESRPNPAQPPQSPYKPMGGSNWERKIESKNRASEREFYRRLEERRSASRLKVERKLEKDASQAEQRQLQQQQRLHERTRDMFRTPGPKR